VFTRRPFSEILMSIRMPDATLRLGRHLDAAAPPSLSRIDEPALTELLSTVEPAGCENCGADDWADLNERMHYIFHLFRAYHENARVFDAPFTAAQTTAIRAGQLPSGRL
jgi:hypothetical protein